MIFEGQLKMDVLETIKHWIEDKKEGDEKVVDAEFEEKPDDKK